MRNKTTILFLWCFLSFLHAYAQYTGPIWYFGENAGINFSQNPPIAITDGKINSIEGCATISDLNGNLFFYTDGETVWNRNHQVMINGTELNGDKTTTQSAVIVQQPSSAQHFYIFTADRFTGSDGLCYSIVDMGQDDGLGMVIEKNTQLITPISEKLTIGNHANGKDVWVITHEWNSDAFYAYLITDQGISNPVISNSGTVHQGGTYGYYNSIGYMKLSPSGEKLSLAIFDAGIFELFDFDSSTGVISHHLTIYGGYRNYAVEFSPNSQLLYVKSLYSGDIFQYNLSAGSDEEIILSKTWIGEATNNPTPVNYISGALQLGIDGRIYVAKYQHDFLSVIEHPDMLGTACNFIDDGFGLNGRRSTLGLPFAGLAVSNAILSEYYCFGDSTQFWIQSFQQFDSVSWDFGDPVSGTHNTSNLLEPKHVFSSPGNYEVTVNIYHNANITTLQAHVEIFPSPIIDLGQDTTLCEGNYLILDPGASYESYIWQNGSTMSVFTVVESGLYWVEVSNTFGCTQRDSIFVTIAPKPEVWLGNDSILCEGDTLILCTDPGYESYAWQDGSGENCFIATNSGIYWVELTNEFGCSATDSIQLTFLGSSDFSLGNDTVICFEQTLTLDAGWGYDSYLWHDGSTGQTLVIEQSGNYWVEVSSKCGIGSDTISVDFSDYFEVSLGNDTSFCYGHNTILDPGSGFVSYFWQDGSNLQTYTAASSGIYWVIVSDSVGCTATDSVYIDVYSLFDISLGDDTIAFCKGDYIFLHGPEGYENYLWQDGSAFPSILADEEGLFWLEVADANECSARDSIYVMEAVIPADLLGPDRHICPDEMITIAALPGFSTYYWQDGSSNPTFTTELPGKYWVVVQDENGCTGADTISINPFKIPDFGLEPSEPICPGDSLLLAVDEGHFNYIWQNDSTNSHSLWVNQEGLYHIQVETICGIFNDSIEVFLHYGNLDLGNDTVMRFGEQLMLYPGQEYTQHYWSTGSYDSTIVVNEAGIYWLEAFDGVCFVTDSIRIDFFADIVIPNVFTPNNDGYNDSFYASTIYPDGVLEFKMTIFNRWGRVVHTLENIDETWDGTINGTLAADSVYFWVCEYAIFDLTGKVSFRKRQGSLTLIR